jgi:predicted permease
VGLRKWLIVGQVILTTILLAGAGLFTQSLVNVMNIDLGLQPSHVIEFSVAPALSRYSPAQSITLLHRLRESISAQPGVQSVSAATVPILTDSTHSSNLTAEGYNTGENEETYTEQNWIAPDYFSTMKVPLLAGREFRDTDDKDRPKVAIVNQTLVRRYFAGKDPIGKRIVFGKGTVVPDTEIVGVVADSKHENARNVTLPFSYMPIAQDEHPAGITFYVRTAQEPAAAAGMLRSVVASLDAALPVYNVETLSEQANESMLADRMMAFLCIWLGLLAAVLAAMGLYGVMAYIVLRRTREIGIRMALGASRETVAWMVLQEVMRLALKGLLIGLILAVATGRLIESQLFGVKGWNPLVLALTAVLLLAVALAAGSLPARRAARVQPVIALRYE